MDSDYDLKDILIISEHRSLLSEPARPILAYEQFVRAIFFDETTGLEFLLSEIDHREVASHYREYQFWIWQDLAGWAMQGISSEQLIKGLEKLTWRGDYEIGWGTETDLNGEFLKGLSSLHFDFFGPHAKSARSATSPDELSIHCWMYWDGATVTSNRKEVGMFRNAVIAEIWVLALESGVDALQECALHGIGHAIFCARRVDNDPHNELVVKLRAAVQNFIQKNRLKKPDMTKYAREALRGSVL
jgi:hypothetical protein